MIWGFAMDIDPPTARFEQMGFTAEGAEGLELGGVHLRLMASFKAFKSRNIRKGHRVLSTLGLVPFIDEPILWGDMLEYLNSKCCSFVSLCMSQNKNKHYSDKQA